MNEKEQMLDFINHLKSLGYPAESIVTEYKIGNYYADIVIVDDESKTPIQIYELKSVDSPRSRESAQKQLKRAREVLSPLEIETYLVTGSSAENNLNIVSVIDYSDKMTADVQANLKTQLSSYDAIKTRMKSKSIANRKAEQKDNYDILKWISFTSGFLVLILLGLDIGGFFELTGKQLSLFGLGIGLFIIPFASKLKILGFEFERKKKDE